MLYEQMYGGLYFEFYGHIFAVELLISLLFFVVFQTRRKYFAMRASLSVAGYILLVTLTGITIRAINKGVSNYNPVFFLLVTLYLAVAVFCSFKTNILGAIYYATGAYAVQHAAYSVSNILRYLIMPEWHVAAELIVFDFLVYILVGFIFFGVFVWPRRHKFNSDIYDLRALILSAIILVICIMLSSSSDNIFAQFLKLDIDISSIRIFCSIYAVLGCIGCIVIQFGFLRENKLTDENNILDELIHTEKKRNEMDKETINMINTKFHDLKHQISILEKVDDMQARKAYIAELKECIAVYDSGTETGNDALDIVLSEKSLSCEKNNIAFSCLADGALLSFMSSTDIASLFGNAFDNAIERQLSEQEENRFISLSVKEVSGFIYVHMDNFCEKSPEFVDGLPQTTKDDTGYHGFGTKSISNIVYKYSGEIIMGFKDQRFNLDILFPTYAKELKLF